MGTIQTRNRKDGTKSYQAQLVIKRDGQIMLREQKTFDRKQAAAAWLERRETELNRPGGVARGKGSDPFLGQAIDRYIDESLKAIGRTKAQVLRAIKDCDIATKRCSEIHSSDLVSLARQLSRTRTPQTVGNYMSHLGAIFSIARAAWDYPLDPMTMKDAHIVCKRMGLTGKSRERDRRPTIAELNLIMTHYQDREKRRPSMAPMTKIILFAIFSTRRQEEIVTIRWADLDETHNRVLVRDMKNPGEKIGNNVWCDLTPEAMRVVKSMARTGERIFPFTTDALSASFTRTCQFLGIKDLHFHDLRHDGVSRLFEMGNSIPHVAANSGHRSWQSLKRYTHIRQAGDKYAGWKWLERICNQGSADDDVTCDY
ncbi:site-specific integrase [Asticcacaulis sp.]|uniref:site-specific integrase n=1 Tax=Asticcacaulis sp. TaxID=1872648 RepID=UPI003F7CC245